MIINLRRYVGLALICGCGPGADLDDVSVAQQSIANGQPGFERGVGTLFLFEDGEPAATCTATRIAPSLLVTAAHCLQVTPGKKTRFGFYPGAQADPSPAGLVPATKVIPHPDYIDRDDANAPSATLVVRGESADVPLGRADIGLVELADSFDVPVRDFGPAQPSASIVLWGAGRTTRTGSSSGTLRTATNVIDGVALDYFYYTGATADDGNICSGDSGGPTFDMSGRLIGVHSSGTCQLLTNGIDYSIGIDTRIEPYLAWIAEEMARVAARPPPQLSLGPDISGDAHSRNVEFTVTSEVGLTQVRLNVDGRDFIDETYKVSIVEEPILEKRFLAPLGNLGGGVHSGYVDFSDRASHGSSDFKFDNGCGCQATPAGALMWMGLALVLGRKRRSPPKAI